MDFYNKNLTYECDHIQMHIHVLQMYRLAWYNIDKYFTMSTHPCNPWIGLHLVLIHVL